MFNTSQHNTTTQHNNTIQRNTTQNFNMFCEHVYLFVLLVISLSITPTVTYSDISLNKQDDKKPICVAAQNKTTHRGE